MIDEKVLIEVLNKAYDDHGTSAETLKEELMKQFKHLASEHNNGWIPCSERLPENNHDVYVTYINKMTGDSISSVGWYSQEEKAWFVGHNDTRQKVTAWCPKLPPYKKGE